MLARGRGYSRVATAGGRVAFVGSDGLREGERVFIVDAATRRTVFRGPPAWQIGSLHFDGRHVAFTTTACGLAGPAVSRRTIPRGPCNLSRRAGPANGGATKRVSPAPALPGRLTPNTSR